jgi:hypothetical protein
LKNWSGNRSAKVTMPDNNTAERAVRPVTLGRKNYLFMGLSYVFPIDLQRLSHCPLSQFWRALAAAGSIWAWS